MREPSFKNVILFAITVLALVLTMSGAEMLTNMDPHPLAGCLCIAFGLTWIILIVVANSEIGDCIGEDVKELEDMIEWMR